MKEEELRQCQIQEWYPLFKSHSIPTLFHPLPNIFIQYILGISPPLFLLPKSETDTETETETDTDTETETLAPSFPILESAVNNSISALGGAVFPKLNWSSPKDAAWISAVGSLRCTSFVDIALLLRASDRTAHDLCHAIDHISDSSSPPDFPFFLALRKFYSFRPEMEFRCFVRRGRLVGISQREVTAFYPSILERRRELRWKIEGFFDVVVRGRFGLEDYCFDVYVTGDGRVKVVDFNPWGGFTLGLLFGWEEMEEEGFWEEGMEVEFRIVDGRCGVRPGLKTAVPFDYLDRGEGSGWDEFLRKADEELGRQMKDLGNGSC